MTGYRPFEEWRELLDALEAELLSAPDAELAALPPTDAARVIDAALDDDAPPCGRLPPAVQVPLAKSH